MQLYRERLWPAPWIFISTALVIPASLLVFLPISPVAGVLTAVVLYGGCVVLLVVGAPTVSVSTTEFTAGRARLPIELVGRVEAFSAEEASLQRGRLLDMRAWLLLRGWVSPVVRLEVTDPEDPAPYWLVSTRRPAEVLDAIEQARRGAGRAG